ncbi:hypothetical protein [Methylobacterium sp. 77]|uniref:hypothetical protein n=1 Tax=Methylobacterium sp. 77 TaxID=1101192 RepID=UPI00039FFEE1|nr:hypothetical protein [Methylobacterium sp. 77]
MPRKDAVAPRAYSNGTRKGSDAVVDLAARLSPPMALPRMDFGESWYHAEAILDDGRTRKV